MHPKIKEFFDTKGRRLAELKAIGGQEFMVLGKTDKLNDSELIEFKMLTIQMDAILWALRPENNQEKYVEEIKNYFANIEEPYFIAQDIKKGRKIPKGVA